MTGWTTKDVTEILRQLDERGLPFRGYTLFQSREEEAAGSGDGGPAAQPGEGLHPLGEGAFARVYRAWRKPSHGKAGGRTRMSRRPRKRAYAVKLIGFGENTVDTETFRETVEAQTGLSQGESHVVRVYESTQLLLQISGAHTLVSVWREQSGGLEPVEEVGAGEGVRGLRPTPDMHRTLRLQFILMEELTPILVGDRWQGHRLHPDALGAFEEREILKLAYDVGMALQRAHGAGLLHRDVKPENVFYSEKDDCYKLGDFGVAKQTEDGFVRTVAFTPGYGAPEVVYLTDDAYDCTADIYSFGMLLYVLLNGLRFPQSRGYRSNTSVQYRRGYVPPLPEGGSDALRSVVMRMCSYDPAERYQSMEEVMQELDGLYYDADLKLKREHNAAPLAIAAILAVFGAVLWKLSFLPDFAMDLGVGTLLLLGLGVGKLVLRATKRSVFLCNTGVFLLGLYLMMTTGVSPGRVALWLAMLLLDVLSGVVSAAWLAAWGSTALAELGFFGNADYTGSRWMALSLVSMAVVLLFLYYDISIRSREGERPWWQRKWFWPGCAVMYAMIGLIGVFYAIAMRMPQQVYVRLLGAELSELIASCALERVGLFGILFSAVWGGRELFFRILERQRSRQAILKMRQSQEG